MMRQPKISIVIPIYNVEEYIAQCLLSVIGQTYKGAIECILVDDCGNDNSIVIVEQLIADYKGPITFRLLHHKRNRGLSAARNTGTDVATGDYIYYIDSDDFISNDCIELLVAPLTIRDYDMVIGNYDTFGDYKVSTLLFEEQSELIGNKLIFQEFAKRQLPVTAWNKLCKLSFLKNNGIDFLEGQLHEDDLWTYKICLTVSKIAIQHKISYYYRQRNNSIVYDPKIKSKQRFDSVMYTVNYILEHNGHVNPEDHTQCALTYIGKCLSYAIDGDFDFYNEYKTIRNKFMYRPIYNYFHQNISAIELKRSIHYALPLTLGYWYFLLRRVKTNKSRK